jgi:hypothetical protein
MSFLFFPRFGRKRDFDLSKLKKWQMALVGLRYWLTCRMLDQKTQGIKH